MSERFTLRPRESMHALVLLLCLLGLLGASGCNAITRHQRDRQLKRVAKDWSKTLRASQIIPVYPTTEDLQPGDLFLVRQTVDEQHKAFKGNDYLELDNHLDRINPSGYASFYRNSFLAGEGGGQDGQGGSIRMPSGWLSPGEAGAAWGSAPKAYFPSYAFSTSAGTGANAAFPVQAVPIGLSLIGSGKSTVTVHIKDARTLGVDIASLHGDVRKWEAANRLLLRQFGSTGDHPVYLRVISRIYLAGEMTVGIQDTDAISASASGGAPKPVDLLLIGAPEDAGDTDANRVDHYASGLEKLNTAVNKGLGLPERGDATALLPGGAVKVVSASSGSITLNEKFERPVVIGYLGFDMAIGEDGILGPPAPTLAVVRDRLTPPLPQLAAGTRLLSGSVISQAYGAVEKRAAKGDTTAIALREAMNQAAQRVLDEVAVEGDPDLGAFDQLVVYAGQVRVEIDQLERSDQPYAQTRDQIKALEARSERIDQAMRAHGDLLRRAVIVGAALE